MIFIQQVRGFFSKGEFNFDTIDNVLLSEYYYTLLDGLFCALVLSLPNLPPRSLLAFVLLLGNPTSSLAGREAEEYLPGPNNNNKGANYVDVTAEKDGNVVRIRWIHMYMVSHPR